MFEKTIIVMLLLLWKQDTVKSVRLVRVQMPTHRSEGDKALLGCQYDMEGDKLYTLKWYKDGEEFYRFLPKSDPATTYFHKPGVLVDLSRSSDTMVFLVNLTQQSEGLYKCEVSGEFPTFTTVYREKFIHVHLIPKTGPHVLGLREEYKLDDIVAANCTLPPSRPEAQLKWQVNDKPAPQEYLTGPWYRVSAERPDAYETILQLRFQTTPEHFMQGPMRLKCQASIPPLYQEETESTHYLDPLIHNEPSFTTAEDDAPNFQEIKDRAAAASMTNTVMPLLLPIIFLTLMY